MFSLSGSFSFKKSASYFSGRVPEAFCRSPSSSPYVSQEITRSHPSLSRRKLADVRRISEFNLGNMLSLLKTLACLSFRPPRPRTLFARILFSFPSPPAHPPQVRTFPGLARRRCGGVFINRSFSCFLFSPRAKLSGSTDSQRATRNIAGEL